MIVTFQTTYFTGQGESLYVETGDRSVRMQDHGNGIQIATIEFAEEEISYFYSLRDGEGKIKRKEWGGPRKLRSGRKESLHIFDKWHDRPETAPFYSTAFRDCFFNNGDEPEKDQSELKKLTIKIDAPTLRRGERLIACGSTEQLGLWEGSKGAETRNMCGSTRFVTLNIADGTEFEYKFAIEEPGGKLIWEGGGNRVLKVPSVLAEGSIIETEPLRDERAHWKCAGTAIPVFSLRSDEDEGTGDFLDLKKMADWVSETGQKIIQILPVNDTTMSRTWRDSYPYNAISTFALHPAYVRLSAIGKIPSDMEQTYAETIEELQKSPTLDYEKSIRLKLTILERLYREHGRDDLASGEFKEFYDKNKEWLRPYAAFCVLRDKYKTCDMQGWGENGKYSPEKVDALEEGEREKMELQYFTQYHLDKQLREVRDYCHRKGVCLKGDIPIGISRTSVDAWQYPHLFNLDKSAGAPPDDFAVLGQNWGFPTYNWEEMSKDGFSWWKKRFMKMADYFDIYRIDHLLGFFRIWEMDGDTIHGLLGTFNRTLPLTPAEMAEKYGFSFDRTLHTRPYITDRSLNGVFGPKSMEVKQKYMESPSEGFYGLKPEYDTQRKIADLFASKDDVEEAEICAGLLRLTDEVLFIEDSREKGKYHPRITPRNSYVYQNLGEEQKAAFDRLYEDFYYWRPVDFWRRQALWKLPSLIDSTGMLCCGEDLGMIPSCVPAVIEELKIFSLKVQRMSGAWNEEFADTSLYPYYSVCTTSTHDMSGIRGWWEEDGKRAGRYFRQYLGGKGDAPSEAMDWICAEIVEDHLESPSMLCILPLQDWLSIDGLSRRGNASEEQINDPSNPDNNWNYRMHLTIEKLIENTAFVKRLQWMIEKSGR